MLLTMERYLESMIEQKSQFFSQRNFCLVVGLYFFYRPTFTYIIFWGSTIHVWGCFQLVEGIMQNTHWPVHVGVRHPERHLHVSDKNKCGINMTTRLRDHLVSELMCVKDSTSVSYGVSLAARIKHAITGRFPITIGDAKIRSPRG